MAEDDAPKELFSDRESLRIRIMEAQERKSPMEVLLFEPLTFDFKTQTIEFKLTDADIMDRFKLISNLFEPENDDSKEGKMAYQALLDAHNLLLDPERRANFLHDLQIHWRKDRRCTRASRVSKHTQAVAARLEAQDPDERWNATQKLALMDGCEEYAEEVAALLEDNDCMVQWAALGALKSMGPDALEQAGAVAALLSSPAQDPHTAQVAAEALGSMGPEAKEHAPQVAKLLAFPDHPLLRRCGAEALGRMQANEFLGHLVNLFNDKDILVRWVAMESVCTMPGFANDAVLANIVEMLESKDKGTRDVASEALVRLGPAAQSTCPKVAALLNHESNEVRACAALLMARQAAGESGAKHLSQLLGCLSDPHPSVRWAVVKGVMQGDCLPHRLVQHAHKVINMMGHEDVGVRRTAQECLNAIITQTNTSTKEGEAANEAFVEEAAQDGHREVCMCLVEVLRNMPPEQTEKHLGALQALLRNLDPDVRNHACEIIGRLESKAACCVDSLVGALQDVDARVRWSATVALGKMREAAMKHVPMLKRLAEGQDVIIRRAAQESLRKILVRDEVDVRRSREKFMSSNNYSVPTHENVSRSLTLDPPQLRPQTSDRGMGYQSSPPLSPYRSSPQQRRSMQTRNFF